MYQKSSLIFLQYLHQSGARHLGSLRVAAMLAIAAQGLPAASLGKGCWLLFSAASLGKGCWLLFSAASLGKGCWLLFSAASLGKGCWLLLSAMASIAATGNAGEGEQIRVQEPQGGLIIFR
jgi:hypothetical protein